MTFALYTNNDEKNIERTLKNILKKVDNTKNKLIIIDDMSKDNTVPIIVSTVGQRFMEEDKYLFHINTTPCGYEESIKKAYKIEEKDDIISVDNKITKKELEKRIRYVTNKQFRGID